jgi:hypothetical protein
VQAAFPLLHAPQLALPLLLLALRALLLLLVLPLLLLPPQVTHVAWEPQSQQPACRPARRPLAAAASCSRARQQCWCPVPTQPTSRASKECGTHYQFDD